MLTIQEISRILISKQRANHPTKLNNAFLPIASEHCGHLSLLSGHSGPGRAAVSTGGEHRQRFELNRSLARIHKQCGPMPTALCGHARPVKSRQAKSSLA